MELEEWAELFLQTGMRGEFYRIEEWAELYCLLYSATGRLPVGAAQAEPTPSGVK